MSGATRAPIRALVVDDEPLGRDVVCHMARAHDDLEIVGECGSVKNAREAVERLRPDVIFLDVEMPGANGFELVQDMAPAQRPDVVFITAYGQHAVRAFEVPALDYLQKPFDQARFDRAMVRVREKRRHDQAADLGRQVQGLVSPVDEQSKGAAAPVSYPDRVTIKDTGRVYFVAVGDIDFMEASGNYVELHVGSKTHLVYDTMAHMEAQLNPAQFLRIHRSQIVNISRIKELQPHFNGEFIVVLHSGAKLKISRGYRDRAKEVLGLA